MYTYMFICMYCMYVCREQHLHPKARVVAHAQVEDGGRVPLRCRLVKPLGRGHGVRQAPAPSLKGSGSLGCRAWAGSCVQPGQRNPRHSTPSSLLYDSPA